MQYLPVTPAHAYACSCPSDLVPSAMDPAPASGSEIEVTVHYKDEAGKVVTARAQEWILDSETSEK